MEKLVLANVLVRGSTRADSCRRPQHGTFAVFAALATIACGCGESKGTDASGAGPGHNRFFKSPGGTEDWIVYHANAAASGACDTRRTIRIQRLTLNPDGMPNFGVPVSTSTDLQVPSGE